MYEFVMPYLRKAEMGFWEGVTSEQARGPLIFLVIAGTVFYQFYWKEGAMFNKSKPKEEEEQDPMKRETQKLLSGLADQARRKGKLTPKMKAEMEEIENMMTSMNSFGEDIDARLSNLGGGLDDLDTDDTSSKRSGASSRTGKRRGR